MTPRFHKLRIESIRPETADAVCVELAVPPALASDFAFVQGQHLTLKFFGNISRDDIYNISAAVQKRIVTEQKLYLKIEKLGGFPDARRPRVLWCGVAGDVKRLINLQKKLDDDFAAIGFPAEDRSFRAHLTLARIKDPRSVSGFNEALTKHNAFTAGECSVGELILFQSKLTPQGAVYTKLAVFPLVG